MARPDHKPTEEARERVAVLAGGGMAHEGIAMVLGICRATLEKWYSHELSIGAYEKRAEVMEALRGAALKGNVAAVKLYLQIEPGLAAPPLPDEIGSPSEDPSKGLGKKAQADADAKVAADGSDWEGLLSDGKVVRIGGAKG